MKLYDLRTSHMDRPVIDQCPEFSWRMASEEKNVLQTAYRIRVWTGEEEVWDSGKRLLGEQSFIPYEGALQADSGYRWQVQAWDNKGNTALAESSFQTGLLKESDWIAKWIRCSFQREAANEYKFGNAYPPVLFEKNFSLKQKVSRAVIYASAYGVYRLQVNGQRPDQREFAPEFTPYGKEVYYQAYDVTGLLQEGENRLSLYVADGWYFSAQAGPAGQKQTEEPACIFQLQLTGQNGERRVIASDGSEVCRRDFIIYSDLYQGEKQDMTFGLEEALPVQLMDWGRELLKCQPMPGIYPKKLVDAVEVFKTPKGETIVDFGQVLAGRARIHVDLPKGASAVFEYFEVLSEEGNYINTMFAPQKDTVISDGQPFVHEAWFTFHGFRYLKVTGIDQVRKGDFQAVVLTTEKEDRASFECSDPRINRLYRNIRWSQCSNMMSVPTDCPSREKAGWTGDILIYARTAMLNEGMTPFLKSWLNSVRLDQYENGTVMIVSPYMKLYDSMLKAVCKTFGDEEITGVAGWSDAIVWVPYDMYQMTGDRSVLKENYGAMKKWADYIEKTAAAKRGEEATDPQLDRYLWNTGFHFGEWLVPSRPHDDPKRPYYRCPETAFYIAPFFGYMTIRRMAEISEILGYAEDRSYYEELAGKMKQAITEAILRPDRLPKELMGGYVLAFAFDLVPEDLRETYHRRLVDLIQDRDYCLDTGFLATPYLLPTLVSLGEEELAEKIFWQDRCPSWLYEVDHGATTIWEAWDADGGQKDGRFISYNHYAFGCVDEFICRKIAGIDSDGPAFRKIRIKPDPSFGLKWCKRTYRCEYGTIAVDWNADRLKVSIPCNTTATVEWKGQCHEIGSGDYCFCDDPKQ